jgi:hypothetical protein
MILGIINISLPDPLQLQKGWPIPAPEIDRIYKWEQAPRRVFGSLFQSDGLRLLHICVDTKGRETVIIIIIFKKRKAFHDFIPHPTTPSTPKTRWPPIDSVISIS